MGTVVNNRVRPPGVSVQQENVQWVFLKALIASCLLGFASLLLRLTRFLPEQQSQGPAADVSVSLLDVASRFPASGAPVNSVCCSG